MKILIPTAKEMKAKNSDQKIKTLSNRTYLILQELLKYDVKALASIYKIKEEQAVKELLRLVNINNFSADVYSAISLFDGLMYRNIKRENLSDREKAYLSANVFITSSFYGIINAYDKISEHRLDFIQNIKVNDLSLKHYWRTDYDSFLENEKYIISLLSSEFEEVFSKKVREKFIKIVFLERQGDKLRTHSSISKKARGKFLTELMQRNVEDIEEIKTITFDSYNYSDELSSEKELIFIGG